MVGTTPGVVDDHDAGLGCALPDPPDHAGDPGLDPAGVPQQRVGAAGGVGLRHGLPVGSEGRSRGQRPVRLPKTSKSLPPMPRVTRSVSRVSPRNCGRPGLAAERVRLTDGHVRGGRAAAAVVDERDAVELRGQQRRVVAAGAEAPVVGAGAGDQRSGGVGVAQRDVPLDGGRCGGLLRRHRPRRPGVRLGGRARAEQAHEQQRGGGAEGAEDHGGSVRGTGFRSARGGARPRGTRATGAPAPSRDGPRCPRPRRAAPARWSATTVPRPGRSGPR